MTDRKMPGSDIVDLMLTMRASEHGVINKILEIFLNEVRFRNPTFFSENFIKILMSVSRKIKNKTIEKKEFNFILDLIVK